MICPGRPENSRYPAQAEWRQCLLIPRPPATSDYSLGTWSFHRIQVSCQVFLLILSLISFFSVPFSDLPSLLFQKFCRVVKCECYLGQTHIRLSLPPWEDTACTCLSYESLAPKLVPSSTINALVNLILGRSNTDITCLGCSSCKTPCPAAAAVPLFGVVSLGLST